MNLYNVLITYAGEGAFKFYLAGIGEVEITPWRPIFLYNASVQVINDLRLLKRSLVNIKINGSPEGAYKIFDMQSIKGKTDRTTESISQKPNIEDIKEEIKNEIREDVKKEVEEELKREAKGNKEPEVKKETPKKASKKNVKSKK